MTVSMPRPNRPIKSVCVYCGSSNRVDDKYKNAASDMGQIIGRNGLKLVYGGGRVGLMGLVADATLEHGGEVLGIIPHHIKEREVDHPDLTELRVVDSMHERKQMMVDNADAFIILPGGLGTMDEFFEIVTWRQLGLHDKPVVIVNVHGFWNPLMTLVDALVDTGFARTGDRENLIVVNSPADVLDALAGAPSELLDPQTKWM